MGVLEKKTTGTPTISTRGNNGDTHNLDLVQSNDRKVALGDPNRRISAENADESASAPVQYECCEDAKPLGSNKDMGERRIGLCERVRSIFVA